MAHAIDMSNGRANVMLAGSDAWHGLGTVVATAQASAEAIKLAGLSWRVEKWPTQAYGRGLDNEFTVRDLDDCFAIVRDDTFAVLGTVGKDYQPIQNSEAFSFFDDLIGEEIAMYETAGSLHDGRKVWMMAKIPREFRVGSEDLVNSYALLTTSHDGSGAMRMIPTTVRVVCQNTLNLALNRAGSHAGVRIPHSGNVTFKIDEARKALGIIDRSFDRFQAQLDALAARSLSGTEVTDYFTGLFPTTAPGETKVEDSEVLERIIAGHTCGDEFVSELITAHEASSEREAKKNAKILDMLLENFENEKNNLPGVEGTAWAAFNAVSEWSDHQRSVRGKDDDDRAQNRTNSNWFGRSDEIKQVAWTTALDLAGQRA